MSGGLSAKSNIGEMIAAVTSVLPQSSTGGTISGSAVDRYAHGVALSCLVHHVAGAITGSPSAASVVTTIEDSADGSTGWGTVPNSTGPTNLTAQNTEASSSVNLSSAKRYVRTKTVVTLTGGSSPAALVAADIILGGAAELPAV